MQVSYHGTQYRVAAMHSIPGRPSTDSLCERMRARHPSVRESPLPMNDAYTEETEASRQLRPADIHVGMSCRNISAGSSVPIPMRRALSYMAPATDANCKP